MLIRVYKLNYSRVIYIVSDFRLKVLKFDSFVAVFSEGLVPCVFYFYVSCKQIVDQTLCYKVCEKCVIFRSLCKI